MFIFLLMLLFKAPDLDSEIIINHNLPLQTKVMHDNTLYTLEDNEFVATEEEYIKFTEGYIEKETYDSYRYLLEPYSPTYLHEVYEDEELIIFCYVSGVYIINKQTKEVTEIGCNLYVSHVKVIDGIAIILGYKPHCRQAMGLYISIEDSNVINLITFEGNENPHQYDFAIAPNGEIISISGELLNIYNTNQSIQLPFEPKYMLTSDCEILVFDESLNIMLLDNEFNESINGQVALPCLNNTIVDMMLYNNYLYIVYFDNFKTKFPNYLCIYDLKVPELTCAVAIKEDIPPRLIIPNEK
ncbi:MAG: hypothetical protein BEN18_02640 [Epulopiscium sp. Nuni2H_MBin001]|nr:MAG: hypothetical protein BEN18_02640 [Epulopiscium sp. Nuni2H_MBin001]